ncbi:hypothetical protein PQO03_11050 [Lentisphaera profundi]|uniref:Uncharacterized protein n=1 Tax=Lentisphaera profundi TaxID=1658616 RepID=A0ABY7VRA2_9BACT|nr:hypothetical protein [Lentisphaera profundi]WDE96244.1 hypothetical protein PQO03_11050 [Lentisphaera profundi]
MPVCSYLAYPIEGKEQALMSKLSSMPECDVTLSDDKKLIILLTETKDKDHEKLLQEKIKQVKDINCLVLSFGQVQN